MNAQKTLGEHSEGSQSTNEAATQSARAKDVRVLLSRRARSVALLTGLASLASVVGCGAERDDPELGGSEQELRASAMDSEALPASESMQKVATTAQQAPRGSATAVQTGGTTVFGSGTTVVAFTRDPDGAWHCVGDADCNKMFLSGVCTGGILDSSCDTTSGVQCWCY
jgi:hypothetical protein